ncbi:hypothetical protein ABHI18_012235 [Aspergillus niger]
MKNLHVQANTIKKWEALPPYQPGFLHTGLRSCHTLRLSSVYLSR